MAIRISRKCYPKFHHNGYDFRKSIRNPDSQLRKVLDILDRDRCIDRYGYFMETRLHYSGDFRPFLVDRKSRKIRVRPGYGASFWSALVKAGVIVNSGTRTDEGYIEYLPGPRFPFYRDMARFFQRGATERIWWYDERYIPKGWKIDE